MKKALVLGMYVLWSFLLASFLWVTGLYDTTDYVIYKGLFALVTDHVRDFVIVVIPLSLLSVWRGVIAAQRMRLKKIKGLRLLLEVALIMTLLGIVLNLVNLYTLGPADETFASKTSFLMEFALVMLLDKVIIGLIFGTIIGLSLFVLNLLLARILIPSEQAWQ